MQQMSTFPGPQNSKELNCHFQDQDSSFTQSMNKSCHKVTNEGGRKIHGKSNMPLPAGSVGNSGKSDDSQSVSSQEHGWTYDACQKNFAVVPFLHPDPYYHGPVAACGNQTMVQSQMLGTVSPRVPLPLGPQQDEPIFVNAKQYHAILRRRQYRARLEAQTKLCKGRKTYLHESRHLHALNRARGPSGRFVNMKKLRESKSPGLINGQDDQVPDELRLNTKMLETDVHQSGSFKESCSKPVYPGITSGSNGDAIYHPQPFNNISLRSSLIWQKSPYQEGESQLIEGLFFLPIKKENLCLYGLPNERWAVNLPAEDLPPSLPEPVLGINFARDGMQQKEWISFVANHRDAWLLAVSFYVGARFEFGKADRHFVRR
ncbi:hypothetical protein HAX54_049079 [Datura stramonium]|uniref:Nuclear transcription factor Y subunit n=1 Tax=Datura stramonium TaxID=4076 RepID=A0ABS8SV85_DATST|nr:hypothetical protein [Datura stramonium]